MVAWMQLDGTAGCKGSWPCAFTGRLSWPDRADDWEDLAAFSDRIAEPTMSYEALLDDLKAHGKI